jgi:AcrR family transcriptional regulator
MDVHITRAARPKQRRSYHHGDLRHALLQAAERELAEKGIEGFSLRGVAKRAQVSHAAPAHHFKDVTGLLTGLAATGFRRFVEAQATRQKAARPDARSQLIAAGLGYVDFATAHPALFRLIFSSKRPDFTNGELKTAASEAFERLVRNVQAVAGADPRSDEKAMLDVMAAWATAHGIADLINGGRAKFLSRATRRQREAMVSELISRAIRQ